MLMRKVIRLHPTQRAFRQSRSIYRGFVGGRGAGKSWIGAYDLCRRALPGRTYMVAAPTYPMLRDASWKTLNVTARDLGILADVNRSETRLTLGNGASILGRSADDPDRLRGPNLSGVWLDEASQMPEESYGICIACLRECGEQGWLSATFTPNGRTHWTYEVFGTGRQDTELFRASTAKNPFLPSGFYDTIKAQYGEQQARQELEGEFVDMEGAEWPASYFDNVWFDEWPERLQLRVMAVDPSKGRDAKAGDYSAIVLLGVGFDGLVYVQADMDRRPTRQIVDAVVSHILSFSVQRTHIEGNGFQDELAMMVRERLRHLNHLACEVSDDANTVNKVVRIRSLSSLFNRTEQYPYGCVRYKSGCKSTEILVNQLRDFPSKDAHDDGPDALEMAARLMQAMLEGSNEQVAGRVW